MDSTPDTGYMLFLRVLLKLWVNPDFTLYRWGLKQEYNRPILGISAKLWNMLHNVQKERWKMLSANDYLDLEMTSSLEGELLDHISKVLGQTLINV